MGLWLWLGCAHTLALYGAMKDSVSALPKLASSHSPGEGRVRVRVRIRVRVRVRPYLGET